MAEEEKSDPPARLPEALVQQFVAVAHGNLDAVEALLAQEPRLIHAAWDWGGGDFETALGAAGHMGRRDIATFLLSQGARLDLFVAAMLGQTTLVKATLDAYPEAARVSGPHGLPLLHHARVGGCEELIAYLEAQLAPHD